MAKSLLVTGAAGFIGANFVHYWAHTHPDDTIVAYDALTYAGNRANLEPLSGKPNFSFVHADKTSREITQVVDRSGVAIRHGHMYAWHLCEALGFDPEDGVVRVSFVHYNTVEEIDRLIEIFQCFGETWITVGVELE